MRVEDGGPVASAVLKQPPVPSAALQPHPRSAVFHCARAGVMSSMRSENFWARVVELDLEEYIPAMKAKNLTTYAKFAFGSDYTPQQADATVLTERLLKPLAGENEGLIPSLRMLWWESWGVATADMKRAAEGSEGDAPRKLSAPEIEARRNVVITKLVGMTITPELDVSDSLITLCVAMYDANRLRYIPR